MASFGAARRNSNGRISPGDEVTLGDGDFRRFLMKITYRNLLKTASSVVKFRTLVQRLYVVVKRFGEEILRMIPAKGCPLTSS